MVDTKVDKTLRTRTTGSAYKRPNFATEFKRHLVEQSFEPGASVALIARRNDVNANLLFKWRRAYLEGAYGLPTLSGHAVSVSTEGDGSGGGVFQIAGFTQDEAPRASCTNH